MTLGEKIRVLRQQAGLSQSQLAEQLHVSRAAVAKWENENGIPDVGNLRVLATYFHCDMDSLLDESSQIIQSENAVVSEMSKSDCDLDYENAEAMLAKEELQNQLNEVKHSQACFLKDYLWIISGLCATQVIMGVLFSDFLVGNTPILQTIRGIIESLILIVHGVILLRISTVDDRLKTAGWCMLLYSVCAFLLALPVVATGANWKIALISIVAIVVDVYRAYHEFSAFGIITEKFDPELSEIWNKVYILYSGANIAVLCGLIFTVLLKTLGLLIMLIASICSLIASILVLYYRYATTKIIENEI